MKNYIITETQMKKISQDSINSIVLRIKDLLDSNYARGTKTDINKGRANSSVVIGVKGNNGDIIGNITPKELYYIVEDEIKRYAHKGDKREEFIKQIITDWYNNKIDGSGNLSKNITLW